MAAQPRLQGGGGSACHPAASPGCVTAWPHPAAQRGGGTGAAPAAEPAVWAAGTGAPVCSRKWVPETLAGDDLPALEMEKETPFTSKQPRSSTSIALRAAPGAAAPAPSGSTPVYLL